MSTRTLRATISPLDIAPLARLEAGRLELLTAAFPAVGDAWLVVWRPGRSPAFALVRARILRRDAAWFADVKDEGYVVLWAPAQGF